MINNIGPDVKIKAEISKTNSDFLDLKSNKMMFRKYDAKIHLHNLPCRYIRLTVSYKNIKLDFYSSSTFLKNVDVIGTDFLKIQKVYGDDFLKILDPFFFNLE